MIISEKVREDAKKLKESSKYPIEIYALFQGEKLKMIGTLSAISKHTTLTRSTLDNYRSKRHIENATGEEATRLLLIE